MGKKPRKSSGFDCCVCFLNKRTENGARDIFEDWIPAFLSHPTTIATEMSKLANVEIPKLLNHPTLLCKSCFHKLDAALQFVVEIRKSVEIFDKQLATKECSANVAEPASDVEVKEELEALDEFEETQSNRSVSDSEDVDVKSDEEDIDQQFLLLCGIEQDNQPLSVLKLGSVEADPLNIAEPEDDLKSRNQKRTLDKTVSFSEPEANDQALTGSKQHTENDPPNNTTDISNSGKVCSCYNYDCSRRISKRQLTNISTHFASLKTSEEQRAFVKKLTTKGHILKQINNRKVEIPSYQYFLPRSLTSENSDRIPVCLETFKRIIPFNENIHELWNEDKSPMPKGRRRKNPKNVQMDDIVTSICDHFKELQKRKLKIVRLEKAGLLKKGVESLTYKKMYRLYNQWFKTTNYTKKPKTFKEYKKLLLDNIETDHIITLQESGRKKKSQQLRSNAKTNKDDIVTELTPIKQEYFDDDGMEDADDKSERESIHSNFSDDFKETVETLKQEEVETLKQDEVEEKATKDDDTKCNSSDSEISNDEWECNIDDIKTGVEPKKSTRSSNPLPQEQVVEFNPGDDIEELTTEKTKQITRDQSTIRRYCKVRGLPYVTVSGSIIPKKCLKPPCGCKFGCTEKIPEEQRQFILEQFYKLGNVKKQAAFCVRFTERRPNLFLGKKRDYRLRFYLPLTKDILNRTASKTRVCQKMFCNTVACIKSHPIRAWTMFEKDPTLSGNLSAEESQQIKEMYKPKGQKAMNLNRELKTNEIDFVYRAMPFEEYISCFATKKRRQNILPVTPVGETPEGSKQKKSKSQARELEMKRRKVYGKRYMSATGKIYGEKVMGPPCNCSLRGCAEKIPEEQRQYIFKYFWSLGDVAKHRAFVVRFTDRTNTLRPKTLETKREFSLFYYLPLSHDFDGEKVKVCSKMFCNTLAIPLGIVSKSWRKYADGKPFTFRLGVPKAKTLDEKDVIASVSGHVEHLRREDPELKAFKFNVRGVQVFKFRTMFRLYEKWFDQSKYAKKAKSANMYRTILKHLFYPGGDYDLKKTA